ncbi:MAG: serine acetyltransferase [Anaeromyxobacter sp.]
METSQAVPAQAEATVRAPEQAPRCWSLHHDAAKVYFHRCGTSRPALHKRLKAWIWDTELVVAAVYRYGQLCMHLRERSPLLGLLPFALWAVLQFLVRLVLHVEIHQRCRIGPGVHLGHPYTIMIGATTIGANCSFTHNVTIGMGLGANGPGIPVLGNDVWVGPCSILTGPITIGDGAVIAAGSVVSKDVPAHALVVGNPARVVAANYDSARHHRLPAHLGRADPAAQPGRARRRVAAASLETARAAPPERCRPSVFALAGPATRDTASDHGSRTAV